MAWCDKHVPPPCCRAAFRPSAFRLRRRAPHFLIGAQGAEWTRRAFEGFGLQPYVAVLEQLEADPSFPTVEYPNPEEGEGALALSFARAESVGASLVLANDPDADRLAAAELLTPQEAEVAGVAAGWRVFSGNEIGLLLGHWQWTKFREVQAPRALPAPARARRASCVRGTPLCLAAGEAGVPAPRAPRSAQEAHPHTRHASRGQHA